MPPLPVRIVAGPHSGEVAAWVGEGLLPARGRWLWLVGGLQRPLAKLAVAALPSERRDRLVIETLPGGCPCCAAGPRLGAALARLIRQLRREGFVPDGLILQVEPDGDPGRLADNLRDAGTEAWLRIESIDAVLPVAGIGIDANANANATGAPGVPRLSERAARASRCLAVADRVLIRVTDDDAAQAAQVGGAEPIAAAGEAEDSILAALLPTLRLVPRSDGPMPAGWRAFRPDPFGSVVPDEARGLHWRVVDRYDGAVRFDRRAVAGWLATLQRIVDDAGSASAAGPVALALIARTERDWLGWGPGAAEVAIGWRLDSRLAVLGPSEAAVAAAARTLAVAGLGTVPVLASAPAPAPTASIEPTPSADSGWSAGTAPSAVPGPGSAR